MHMRKRWWISGILTVVLTAGFGIGNAGNGNQQLNMAGQDGITHVYAAELPDEETEIVPFRGRESYILSEWELETEGKLEQAAMVKQYISTMTLREKVCQMIIADPENLVTTHDVTKVDAEMKQALEIGLEIARELGFKTVNLDHYCGYAEMGEGDDIVGIAGHLDIVSSVVPRPYT